MNKMKYIGLGLIGALIGNSIVFVLASFVSDKYGTLADWISGIGTIAAFSVVIWQQYRQENIGRAFRIEQGRPRFRFLYRGELPDKTNILINTYGSAKLYNTVKNYNSALPTLENISDNTIYTLSVIIEYRSGVKEYWKANGIHGGDIVAFVPSFLPDDFLLGLKITELKARFLTISNEIGFYKYEPLEDKGSYFFIENEQNSQIRASGLGKMVSKNNIQIKKWNQEFDNLEKNFPLRSTVPYGQLKGKSE